MLRLWIAVLIVITCASAEDNRWVWGKGHRNQRAFSNDEAANKFQNFYAREKDREPTTRRPPPGQTSQEDFLNPDDLRNYNGPPNFGFPSYGPGGGPPNNYPPGYGQQPPVNVPQNNPNAGFPYPGGQPSFPGAGAGYPGAYPQQPNNGYPTPQGGFPNQQGTGQGYPQQQQPRPGYPGVQGGGGYPGGFQGQPGYPGQGLGGVPFPQQGAAGGGFPSQSGFPGQGGFPSQSGYPSQFQGLGAGFPFLGQYTGCGPFGCGQPGQFPGQYPGQFPYPYQGQYPGQYPTYQEPFAHPHHAGNPYGVTPYNSNNGGAADGTPAHSPSDDYEDLSKNGTDNMNSALKVEGKSDFSTKSSAQKNPEKYKHKKAYE